MLISCNGLSCFYFSWAPPIWIFMVLLFWIVCWFWERMQDKWGSWKLLANSAMLNTLLDLGLLGELPASPWEEVGGIRSTHIEECWDDFGKHKLCDCKHPLLPLLAAYVADPSVFFWVNFLLLLWWFYCCKRGETPYGYELLTLLGALSPNPHEGHFPSTLLGCLFPNLHPQLLISNVIFAMFLIFNRLILIMPKFHL